MENIGNNEEVDYNVCSICGNTVKGSAPDICPVCGYPASKFDKVD